MDISDAEAQPVNAGVPEASVPVVPDVPVEDVVNACGDVTGPYDVIMLNTPWHRMTMDDLGKLPIADMAAEDATLFMWTDSAMAGSTARLMKKYGFTFHSVANILNVAEPVAVPMPAAEDVAAAAASSESAESAAAESAEPAAAEPAEPAAAEPAEPASDDAPADGTASKPKTPRAPRIKTLHPPNHWMDMEGMLVRLCTEQLWMATRGAGAPLAAKVKPLPYQVNTNLEYAKRSCKLRKPSATCPPDWFCTRPSEFFTNILKQLSPDVTAIEMFGDSVQQDVDSFGPGIPQFFVPALGGFSGDVGMVKEALDGMGKVAVRTLCAKLHKALAQLEGALDEPCVVDLFIAIRAIAKKAGGSVDKWVPDNPTTLLVVSKVVDSFFTEYPQRKKKNKRARDDSDSDKNKERHGIAKPGPVSAALVEFFGEPAGTEIARTDVVSRINAYIRLHNLRAGKHFKLDEKLQKLFGKAEGEGEFGYFNLHELLAPHFPPPKGDKKPKAEKAKGVKKLAGTKKAKKA
ncbi:hypothetical protein JKP88DRAFT_156966 [Tribonema minus]|uniref:DM2 domain-containing protein n=1 Tax=Tribonema minus TaxID=303371 RepID=A0A835Z5E6_9STRA|nr:hypothetical protein JKP88DRAFT_156966 [Tribonema minus]